MPREARTRREETPAAENDPERAASINLANGLAEAQNLLEERSAAEALESLTPENDPSFRLVRNNLAIRVLGARTRAQKYLFFAARALEYELNHPIEDLAKAVLSARNADTMKALGACLETIASGMSVPQSYTREVSVRRMLGITATREDPCTGEKLAEGQQFQRVLLQNAKLDGKGGVTIKFATDLMPGNNLWSTDVCNDRIAAVRAQLVGDFLGDNEAQVNLALTGAAIMRDCGGTDLMTWSLGGDVVDGLGTAVSVVQAGVNSYGKAAVNSSLAGQSVARAEWVLTIPGPAAAPTNSDVDLTKIEDILLEITHEARPINGVASRGLDLSCLAQVM